MSTRVWQPRIKHPKQAGIYPVLKAGYRKWDGRWWYKGSRDPLKADSELAVLPTRKWLQWEDAPFDKYKLQPIDLLHEDAVHHIDPEESPFGPQIDPQIDPTMTITGTDDTVAAALKDFKTRQAEIPPELLSAGDQLIALGQALKDPATTLIDLGKAACAVGLGVRITMFEIEGAGDGN